MHLKASFHTLGCKLNFAETATLSKMLEGKGISSIKPGETPDICVVNTCSVTETADKKARRLIRNLAGKYPQATIIVTGCYAQLKPEEVSLLPGVGMVLGSNEKLRLAEFLDSWLIDRQKTVKVSPGLSIDRFMPSCERGERTRYFLKVQDGCDYFCTYCTIPFARGRSRSGKTDELVKMVREAGSSGGKEVVITGVNIGEYGKDNNQSFFDLLKRLDEVEEIERYRLSSIEPNLLTDEIIEWIAKDSRAFMPHFHIPLQSGSDKVLKLMNRRYDTSLFKSRIETIRSLVPDAFIGVDIIAGARGETEEEWENSFQFAGSLDISRFHVFPYSERPGTKALTLGEKVPQKEKHERVGLLTDLSDLKLKRFIGENVGKRRKVLWEKSIRNELMQGLTDNYLRVEAPFKPELLNNISEVDLLKTGDEKREIVLGRHVVL